MGILRFLLAVSVVIAHSSSIFGFSFVGGRIAVQAFYIISGFYMALILNEKYIGVNNSYRLFITNRFLRLYPIYWTVLLLTILYSVAISIYSKGNNLANFSSYFAYYDVMSFGTWAFLIFSNLFLFYQDLVLFLGLDKITGNLFFTANYSKTNPLLYTFLFVPQAWTVGVELCFYLITPFLVRRKVKIIALFILLSLFVRFLLYHYGFRNDPWSHRFFPTELFFFILGIISYKIYVLIRNKNVKPFCGIIFSGILIFTIFYYSLPIPGKYYVYLFLFFVCLPFIFILTKKWKWDSYVGEMSYPIYISHMFLYTCIKTFHMNFFGGYGLSLTIVSILFSIMLNELISKKIEEIRQIRMKSVIA